MNKRQAKKNLKNAKKDKVIDYTKGTIIGNTGINHFYKKGQVVKILEQADVLGTLRCIELDDVFPLEQRIDKRDIEVGVAV